MSIRDTAAQDQPRAAAPRRRVPWLAVGGAVLALAAAGWVAAGYVGGARSVDAARLRVATVTRGDLVRDISGDGRVIAANSPVLYAIAAGTVTLHAVAGDAVRRGQVLATIDSPELRSALAQEQATLAGLEAEARRALLDARIAAALGRRALDQAAVEQQAASRDLERNTRAFEGGAVAQVDVARAQDTLRKAEIGLVHARSEAGLQERGATLDARNKQQMAERQRAVVTELQRQVDALRIRAPFDGRVGQVIATDRTYVNANAPVLGVVDLSRFEVEITVPESFARDLAIGMPARLTGSGGTHPAQVAAVSPQVVDGQVAARLRFTGPQPPGLRQNQRLSARILLDTRRDVVQVPRGPSLDGGGTAWVVEGRTATRRPVRIGAASLDAVEVLDGLRPGERVVVSGADLFGDVPQARISGDLQ